MEEFITTVILVAFNFGLDVRDTFTRHTGTPTYYEVEKSDNVPQARSVSHYQVHSKGGKGRAGKRVLHRVTVVDWHERSRAHDKFRMAS